MPLDVARQTLAIVDTRGMTIVGTAPISGRRESPEADEPPAARVRRARKLSFQRKRSITLEQRDGPSNSTTTLDCILADEVAGMLRRSLEKKK